MVGNNMGNLRTTPAPTLNSEMRLQIDGQSPFIAPFVIRVLMLSSLDSQHPPWASSYSNHLQKYRDFKAPLHGEEQNLDFRRNGSYSIATLSPGCGERFETSSSLAPKMRFQNAIRTATDSQSCKPRPSGRSIHASDGFQEYEEGIGFLHCSTVCKLDLRFYNSVPVNNFRPHPTGQTSRTS